MSTFESRSSVPFDPSLERVEITDSNGQVPDVNELAE